MAELYDRLGIGYRELRRPDPRLAAAIEDALGAGARPLLNVGAGAGSYEPRGGVVVALEPSAAMVAQRPQPPLAAPAVRGTALRLPFADGTFAAAMAVLTVHHWPDRAQGLRELRRVARGRVVVLNHDPLATPFWLVDEYFPEVREIDSAIFPTRGEFEEALGPCALVPVPVPADCTDGFLGAYWRRPRAYLDARVRAAISTFDRVTRLAEGLANLRRDLDDGTWERRHGDLLALDTLDLGYRLVVSGR
jgi:SAM-dependent methyltransferase